MPSRFNFSDSMHIDAQGVPSDVASSQIDMSNRKSRQRKTWRVETNSGQALLTSSRRLSDRPHTEKKGTMIALPRYLKLVSPST